MTVEKLKSSCCGAGIRAICRECGKPCVVVEWSEPTASKDFGLICVDCGGNATEGSMRHPYCKQCYDKRFKNDQEYEQFMAGHG